MCDTAHTSAKLDGDVENRFFKEAASRQKAVFKVSKQSHA